VIPSEHRARARAKLVPWMEVAMSVSVKTLGIDQLGVDERLALVEEIWATICADAKAFPLSDAQRAELDRRVADDDSFPEDVVPWDEVKAAVRSRLGR
ncbi:MAG: addiction module protein, partial [Betaproteobacteria bacterium]